MKKVKAHTILTKDDRKIFHSKAKLIASDSEIEEAFKLMHQSIMAKTKNYASEDCIVLDVSTASRFLSVSIRRKNRDNK